MNPLPRATRRALGLSAAELGRRLGVSASYVRQAERGQAFGYDFHAALAKELGLSLSDFLPTPGDPGAKSTRKPAGARSRPAAEAR